MTIERIVDYVMHTPHNTNRAVLTQMLKELVKSGPDVPDEDRKVIYDGGEES